MCASPSDCNRPCSFDGRRSATPATTGPGRIPVVDSKPMRVKKPGNSDGPKRWAKCATAQLQEYERARDTFIGVATGGCEQFRTRPAIESFCGHTNSSELVSLPDS